MKLVFGSYMKFAVYWEENDSFDRDINLLRGILLTGGMNKYWAVKWSCPPIPGGSHKGSEEAETVRLWWGQQGNIKGGEHFL